MTPPSTTSRLAYSAAHVLNPPERHDDLALLFPSLLCFYSSPFFCSGFGILSIGGVLQCPKERRSGRLSPGLVFRVLGPQACFVAASFFLSKPDVDVVLILLQLMMLTLLVLL